jgi:soluble lytic murein transglycosylase
VGVPDLTSRLLLEFAHPAAYASAVAHSTRHIALDPYLLLAVARRESVFQADVRSHAGAVGLLQLVSVTATRAAAVLGRRPPDELELTDPAVALDLGAWYLAELFGKTGDVAPTLASYNAGPRAAGSWIAKGRGAPTDEWVEDIPYRETRHYVKAVIGAWSTYRLLAGGTAPCLAERVPKGSEGAEF